MISLTQFLVDLSDSDNLVQVSEKQLREYAMQCNEWRVLAEKQEALSEKLRRRIDCLNAEYEVLKQSKGTIIDLTR